MVSNHGNVLPQLWMNASIEFSVIAELSNFLILLICFSRALLSVGGLRANGILNAPIRYIFAAYGY